MSARRLSDWETRLSAYLQARGDVEAVWGVNDCALTAADAVLAQTGVDYGESFRGKYTSAAGAARALKRYGAGDLEKTFDSFLDVRPLAFARRGDIVSDGDAVGICYGDFALFVPDPSSDDGARVGLIRIERARWLKAWAV